MLQDGLTAAGLAFVAAAALGLGQAAPERFTVPNDPNAVYEVLLLDTRADGWVEIVTRRTGGRGDTFVRREIDCARGVYRYLGQGHSIAEMNASRPDHTHQIIDPNTITGHVAAYACARAG